MTYDEVTTEVIRIRQMAGDPETAHSAEDDLHQGVLAAIANGAENPATLAKAALATKDIEFPRWCA